MYKVHRFDLNMNTDQSRLEEFLNSLKGEVISITPNVQPAFMFLGGAAKVNFVLIVEKV